MDIKVGMIAIQPIAITLFFTQQNKIKIKNFTYARDSITIK